ncbi:hypothetical protein K3495_g4716 [Podosphaera aphanis]|nr:hypothetical protein K3495_g4716 [Podosphaera aphanis]
MLTQTVQLSDENADLKIPVDGTRGCLKSFRQLKQRYPHLKLIFSVGGGAGSGNFSAVASSPISRETFAGSAKTLVDTYGFDGIDIDWETPSSAEGANYIELLAIIRRRLPSPNFLLTSALPAGKWALQNIDLVKARDHLDFINLMAYDFNGPWSATSGYHGQLYARGADENSGSAAVDYATSAGFPAAKLLFGIPVYGRSFLGATGPKQKYSGHGGEEGTFEYKNLPRPGCEEVTNTHVVAASCNGGDGGFVSYDNAETVRIKGEYVRKKKLAGLFYWTGTSDVHLNSRSLISAGFNALNGSA